MKRIGKLHTILVNVPFHYLGGSYYVFDVQGKLLGHIRHEEHPMYRDEKPGWAAEGLYPGIHYPPMDTIESALTALLLREHNSKPGAIYRMKSEEWTIQVKPGGKPHDVREYFERKLNHKSL